MTPEERWERIKEYFTPPEEYRGKLGDFKPVLRFYDGRPVQTPAEWPQRRAEILKRWREEIGAWPTLLEKPAIEYLEEERREGFTRRIVRVELGPDRTRDCYLLVPDGEGPFPAVVVVFYDAETGAGLNEQRRLSMGFGYLLAKRGFVALCVGDPGSDMRIQPLSHLAYVAANCHTVLARLPQVDPERIGIVGHSFGGKWAMFASCLYEKFACAVWVDPGIVWNEKDPNANFWEPWYLGHDPQRKRKPGVPTAENPRTGAYKRLVEAGHDLHELHALMAPRPFLVSGGAQDRPPHWLALNHSIAVNAFLGHTDRVAMTMREGHTPTPESNEQLCLFFEHFLSPKGQVAP